MKKILTVILVILILVVGAVLYMQLHGTFEARFQWESNNLFVEEETLCSAHRMGGANYPEDTLMAAKGLIADIEAGKYTVGVIEADLCMTKDGKLILLHDETLDRTTDSERVLGVKNAKPIDYTLEELERLNFAENFESSDGNYLYRGLTGANLYEDIKVLTLDKLLDFLSNKGDFKYILEIKDSGDTGIKAMDILAETVRERGLTDKALLASFHEEVLYHIDEAYPDMHRHASLNEVTSFYTDFLLNKDITKCEYKYDVLDITPRYGIYYGDSEKGRDMGIINLSAQGFINRAHKCGISVFYWTVNNSDKIDELKSKGADVIITDYPEEFD